MLGEITHDDATYTGDTGDSPLSLQYYRNKVGEYQSVLVALDEAAWSAVVTLDILADDPAFAEEKAALQSLIDEYDSKKSSLVLAAESLNGIASIANASGVRFPVLSIPSGLGLAPLAIAGAAAAVAVAVGLIIWGRDWISRVMERQQTMAAIAAIENPDLRDRIAGQVAVTSSAADKADNPLSQVAASVKWVALIALGYFGWRAYEQFSKGKN